MSSIQDSAMHTWVNGESITQDKLEQNRKVFQTAINDNQSQISAQYTNAQIDIKINNATSTKVVQTGTAFPTGTLADGQEFYRDDLKALYIYDISSTSWMAANVPGSGSITNAMMSNEVLILKWMGV